MTDDSSTATRTPGRPVEACLDLIAGRGWHGFVLRDVASESGLGMAELFRTYPSKVALLRAWLREIDAALLAGEAPAADETARDRLFDVLMRRFDLLAPRREVLRRLRHDLRRDPITALELARQVERSMAAVLEAAGLGSDGLIGRFRRRGLLLLEARVFPVFCDDDSVDLAKTMAAVDRQLKSGERWMAGLERWTARLAPHRPEAERQAPPPAVQ